LKGDPIPVIALAAHALAGEREKAVSAGCDEFDTKQFDRRVDKRGQLASKARAPVRHEAIE
jgi:two-component system, cell cycle response regulator DivK